MFLVDTNVLSELTRPAPNPGVLEWAGSISAMSLSVVTVDEIYFGLTSRPNARILAWFEVFLSERCEVLPISQQIARISGQLRGQLRAQGKARTQADMLIAGTAKLHGLTLVTRNTRDFDDCGVILLNPFTT